MLHMVNGGATLQRIQEAGLPGDYAVFDEILMEGPARDGIATDEDRALRALYLERTMGIPRALYAAKSAEAMSCLEAVGDYDELVLWSEEDLFCQINLAYVLHRLEHHPVPARVSLICPADAPVSTRSAAELLELFSLRESLRPGRMALSSRAWTSWCLPTPGGILQLMADDFSDWPRLRRGLRCHLERFPSVFNGLSRLEHTVLEVLEIPQDFPALFRALGAHPALSPLGLGDLQVAASLTAMASGETSLITIEGGFGLPLAEEGSSGVQRWSMRITDAGRMVRAGGEDAIRLNGIDRWLGGVHLFGRGPVWRWDEVQGQLAEF